jgi:hypothetical protein
VVLVLLLLWNLVPLEDASSSEDAPEGAPQTTTRRKWPGRVAVMRTTVTGTNDQLRLSWRTIGGTVETAIEPSYRGS